MKKIWLYLIIALVGCYATRWDYRILEQTSGGVVFIETIGKYEVDGQVVDYKGKAIAIPLPNNRVVALTHATEVPKIITFRTPFGYLSSPCKPIEEKHFIDGEEIKLLGRKNDVSIFEAEVSPMSVRLGDSDLLRVGTDVIVVGWSMGREVIVKDGIVSDVVITTEGYKGITPLEDMFLHSVPVNRGDSGSPVIAKNLIGEYEIVGIVNAMIRDNGMAFAIKVNVLKDFINDIS